MLSTYGVLFLGTPHLDLGAISFEQTLIQIVSLRSSINVALRQELHQTSQTLQIQLRLYTPLGVGFKTIFFYETLAMGDNGIVSSSWT